jgi:hypothetical protein
MNPKRFALRSERLGVSPSQASVIRSQAAQINHPKVSTRT